MAFLGGCFRRLKFLISKRSKWHIECLTVICCENASELAASKIICRIVELSAAVNRALISTSSSKEFFSLPALSNPYTLTPLHPDSPVFSQHGMCQDLQRGSTI